MPVSSEISAIFLRIRASLVYEVTTSVFRRLDDMERVRIVLAGRRVFKVGPVLNPKLGRMVRFRDIGTVSWFVSDHALHEISDALALAVLARCVHRPLARQNGFHRNR
jgi:hypothetical protein